MSDDSGRYLACYGPAMKERRRWQGWLSSGTAAAVGGTYTVKFGQTGAAAGAAAAGETPVEASQVPSAPVLPDPTETATNCFGYTSPPSCPVGAAYDDTGLVVVSWDEPIAGEPPEASDAGPDTEERGKTSA